MSKPNGEKKVLQQYCDNPQSGMLRQQQVLLQMLLLVVAFLMTTVPAAAQTASVPTSRAATVTAKLMRYCELVIKRYDKDADGQLDRDEWAAMKGQPDHADLNADGVLTVNELARYAAAYGSGRHIRLSARPSAPNQQDEGSSQLAGVDSTTPPAETDLSRRRSLQYFAPIPGGTPSWFVERDADGDAQLTLAEFSPRLRATEVAEFKRYDLNGDGVLTPTELSRAGSKPAATAPLAAPTNPTATP